MRWWYLYLAAALFGLVIAGYIIVKWNSPINLGDVLNMGNQTSNTERGAGKMPEGAAVPQEILRLRQQQQLRPLTEREDGAKIQDLPNGIYGFAMCNVDALRAKRGDTFALEIHKHEGIVFYVGYTSEEQIEKYLTRQNNFHILTSPHSRKGTSFLFEIPVEFVAKCDERPVEDGYLFDLFVTAIPELQT